MEGRASAELFPRHQPNSPIALHALNKDNDFLCNVLVFLGKSNAKVRVDYECWLMYWHKVHQLLPALTAKSYISLFRPFIGRWNDGGLRRSLLNFGEGTV